MSTRKRRTRNLIHVTRSGSVRQPVETASKGPNNQVEISEKTLKALIQTMRDNHETRIHELHGKLKHDYNRLLFTVSICDSSQRRMLEKLVRDAFGDVPKEKIQPATLGSWCAGCLVSSGKVCSPLCANSIQFGTSKSCEGLVISAEYQDGRYRFNVIKKPPSTTRSPAAYIQVSNRTYAEFPGFSQDELRTLAKHGVERGYINGMNMATYVQLHKFSSIDEIKKRHASRGASAYSSVYVALTLAVVILLILVMLWFAYRLYYEKPPRNGNSRPGGSYGRW